MSKDPAFLFYSSDFDQGTKFFTDEQVGKYIRLMIAQHQHGHLSENQMLFICKSYDNHVFSKFVKDSNGLFFNERLEEEIIKRKNYSESRSKNKLGKKIICSTHDEHMENENENVNSKDNGVKNSGFVISDPKQLFEEMNQPGWRDPVLMSSYAKGLTEKQFDIYLREFIEIQRDSGTLNRSIREYRSHFVQWLRKKI